jgi:GGDEF domain-containing protein
MSLKSYFFRGGDKDDNSEFRRIVDLFLQGIALHAVEGDHSDYQRFRADIDALAAKLASELPMVELYVIVGGALRTLEDYNRRTSQFVETQGAEMQKIVSMLTQTVITIGASSKASANILQDIEKSIERAGQVQDIQDLKGRLGESLEAIREEARRQKQDGQSALQILQLELDGSRQSVGPIALAPDVDAATGLPGKVEAGKMIRAATDSPDGKYLLIAVISRVQAVNARFGYAVGDRVLALAAEHFRNSLAASDLLYRWQGPAFLAVLSRRECIDHVRSEIGRFADAKLEKTVDVGNRRVLIPISAVWSIFQVAPPLDDLIRQVEAFTAAQAPRDSN